MTFSDLSTLLPEIALVIWASVLLLVDLFIPKARKGWTAFLAVLGLALAFGMAVAQGGGVGAGFHGMVVSDGFATFLEALLALSGALGILLAYDYLKRQQMVRGEYYTLLLFSVAGMMLMAKAADLMVMFLALELLSIPLYVLTAFARPREIGEEAALKYFLLGAFAAAFFVYGIALTYGATQTTQISGIAAAVDTGRANLTLLAFGAGLLLVGLGFKVAAVPFHMWTPDVYQGAPSPVTGFMAAGAKVAGFAALLRVLVLAFPVLGSQLTPIVWVLALLTMVVGNLAALAQKNIKRMLAYSSIAHAGYMLVAVVAFADARVAPMAVAAVLFYLGAYALTNFGAWAVVIAVEHAEGKGLEIADYAGLGRKHPWLALAMTIFMLSFGGFPPTVGFVGKFYLFRVALDAGYVGLAIVGVLASVVSVYYYMRVVTTMYMKEGEAEAHGDAWLNVGVALTALATIFFGIVTAPALHWALQAVLHL
ncbi:MAG TPA: NADH-quinone oxidoreductase subunit N [Chloroflexi bacterium]|nr:NADH-quinone oxidoreductase subunit N [Chloroflexota bacterium]